MKATNQFKRTHNEQLKTRQHFLSITTTASSAQAKLIFSNITVENVEDVQRSTNDTFKIGMWFLSKVIEGHQFEIYEPFESADATMKFAHEHHGITSYRGAPEFDDGMDELLEALKTQ